MNTRRNESANHYRWDEIPLEKLRGTITRRFISAQAIMIAHVRFKKGDDVPRHSHINEQITYIVSGALKIWIGAEDSQHFIVEAGGVLVIPSNVPHRAIALADTLDLDVFSPPRQDWLDRTDAYIRA